MHRKKPNSGKAKKEKLKTHRALKTAREEELSLPAAISAPKSQLPRPRFGLNDEQRRNEERKAARSALESRFIKVPEAVVDHYKSVLARQPFKRPISSQNVEFQGSSKHLTCPKRPKWKYHMLKKEVEKNESMMFNKWIQHTDSLLSITELDDSFKVTGYFERNLDVWRQLWRVSEAADILMALLDVRCPLLHFPSSLQDYLATLKPKKPCILVLTKTDLVPEEITEGWNNYLSDKFGYPVVTVGSYRAQVAGENAQGSRLRYLPGTSASARAEIVAALEAVHNYLITPPARINPGRLSSWKPRVRSTIEWAKLRAEPSVQEHIKLNQMMKEQQAVGKADAKKARKLERKAALATPTASTSTSVRESERESEGEEDEEGEEVTNKPFLSIGLIGQPNVGKSSLLNALLGKKVVRASRTPGKTKHLQTIFWSPEVRLVDCPGLVFPSEVGMESQVLSGIIPIQNVESVVYELGIRAPLEKILNLPESQAWCTDDLLSTIAIDRGFLTAKAARPDIYRAGAIIIRSFQASEISWAFRADIQVEPADGIWLPDFKNRLIGPRVMATEIQSIQQVPTFSQNTVYLM